MCRIILLTLVIAVTSSCTTKQAYRLPTKTSEPITTVTSEPPAALQVLKDAGLMTNDDYKSAKYIPKSNNSMIIADVRSAPCKMIFRYIATSSGNYWMPSQIGCSH